MAATWTVYLVRCRDGSLYTGITTDLERRLAAHNAGTASRYTRSRRPVSVVHEESGFTHSTALKREAAIKRLSRPKKLGLLAGGPADKPRRALTKARAWARARDAAKPVAKSPAKSPAKRPRRGPRPRSPQ